MIDVKKQLYSIVENIDNEIDAECEKLYRYKYLSEIHIRYDTFLSDVDELSDKIVDISEISDNIVKLKKMKKHVMYAINEFEKGEE